MVCGLRACLPISAEPHLGSAARQCRIAGCYRMRSRSPVKFAGNYALKIAAGYVLHRSRQNDSHYFLRL